MTPPSPSSPAAVQPAALSPLSAALLALLAVASFHIAYASPYSSLAIVAFLFALFKLAFVKTSRQAFYLTLAVGLAIYAPRLYFFWTLFQIGAVPLWIILSCWLACFVVIGRAILVRHGPIAWACAAPFVWTGLEYFRSELYYLRFSWLNVGYAFSQTPALPYFSAFGVYGIGFVLMAVVAFFAVVPQLTVRWRIGVFATLLAAFLAPLVLSKETAAQKTVRVAGIQFEFADVTTVRSALDGAIKNFPNADIFVLSEYSFMGPVPETVKKWCANHHKYLVAGGEDQLASGNYYNVAFVIGPDGSIVFQQAKCVPVQLMKDGLAAKDQQVWNSPWGKIGLCICYDASYTRVTDELVRQGAQALIIPTMDVIEWGRRQHELHGRVGPMRAAEYGIPIFRLCSSGISQVINAKGQVVASAPYPAPGALISGELNLSERGSRMPPDRWLALACSFITAAVACWLTLNHLLSKRKPA
jgi:apolipoprotein N-acyltransferase